MHQHNQTRNKSQGKPILTHETNDSDSFNHSTTDDSDCHSIKGGCMPTHRMLNVLMYYSTLNIDLICEDESDKKLNTTQSNESNNIKRTDKEKFIEYITKHI